MPGFTHDRFENHQEIRVSTAVSVPLIMSAASVLSSDPEFNRLHAMWVFGSGVQPLAYSEFDTVLDMLRRLYVGASPGKRVALVAEGSFGLGVAEMFREAASGLVVEYGVFDNCTKARSWLGV